MSLARPEKAVSKIKLSKRKYNGYYKVKLPAIVNDFGTRAINKCMSHIANLTETLWSIDKTAEIYDGTTTTTLNHSSRVLTTPRKKKN